MCNGTAPSPINNVGYVGEVGIFQVIVTTWQVPAIRHPSNHPNHPSIYPASITHEHTFIFIRICRIFASYVIQVKITSSSTSSSSLHLPLLGHFRTGPPQLMERYSGRRISNFSAKRKTSIATNQPKKVL